MGVFATEFEKKADFAQVISSIVGYPEGATPRASDEEREKLARFLRALRGGKSRELITTRKTKTWSEATRLPRDRA